MTVSQNSYANKQIFRRAIQKARDHGFTHFVGDTEEDFARFLTLLFSPGSRKHVIEILSGLAGGKDHAPNQYLYRFGLPKAQKGNVERIFTLGARGKEVLESLGVPVEWYFRPSRMNNQSYGHIVHSLMMTRFLVAAQCWCQRQDAFRLVANRTGYTFREAAGEGQPTRITPDAWLHLERKDGVRGGVLLEIDRGSVYRERFARHIRDRLTFVRSGEYEKAFGEKSVIYAYVVADDNPQFRETRLRSMQKWAMEVLEEEKRENWASLFRFTEVGLTEVYTKSLFDGEVWHRPDREASIRLFG